MRIPQNRLLRGLALLAFPLCVVPSASAQAPLEVPAAMPLQAQAEAIVGRAGDDWSVLAWSLDRNQPLFAIRPNEVMIPASNNKVFTAVWAMAVLGPDYRFPTEMLVTGPIQNGVLQGDLVLRGSGDPSFGYADFTQEPKEHLRIMARQLKSRGVRTVQGGIVADPTAFDSVLFGPEWPRDTGNGVSRYAPRVSGLPYQRNMVRIEVEPTASGKPTVRTIPDVPEIPVLSTVRQGGGRAWATRHPMDDTVLVKGSVAGRGPFRYDVGAAQPALLAPAALREALREEGITLTGPIQVAATPAGARVLHRHFSVPLAQLVPKLNQESDNFFAEHLWQAAAAKSTGRGSFAHGGAASALFFIRNADVPFGQLYQADGSGLSAYNRSSAYALVRALIYAHRAPWSAQFHQSLAVAGDPNGTMKRLFNNTAAEGNLHAKTGYIRGVRTLSGYVTTAGGETVVFSFLYNGRNTSGARGVQSQLGELLASYSGNAPVAVAKPN